MLSLLGPLLGILDKIFGYVANVETTKLQTQAEVDVATIQGTAAVEGKWWFVALTIPLFALPYILYVWKAVAIDKVIAPILHWKGAWATTDPINGPLGTVFWIIVTGIFLHAITNK